MTIDPNLRAPTVESHVTKDGERLFAMQGGPFIPWSLAELIYEAYAAQHGTQQSMERLHERGGFGWKEVEIIFSELARRYPVKLEQLRSRHRISYISPTRRLS